MKVPALTERVLENDAMLKGQLTLTMHMIATHIQGMLYDAHYNSYETRTRDEWITFYDSLERNLELLSHLKDVAFGHIEEMKFDRSIGLQEAPNAEPTT